MVGSCVTWDQRGADLMLEEPPPLAPSPSLSGLPAWPQGKAAVLLGFLFPLLLFLLEEIHFLTLHLF